MAKELPIVTNGSLLQNGKPTIPVGSKEWYTWLEDDKNTVFLYICPQREYTVERYTEGNKHGWKLAYSRNFLRYKANICFNERLTEEKLQSAVIRIARVASPSYLSVKDRVKQFFQKNWKYVVGIAAVAAIIQTAVVLVGLLGPNIQTELLHVQQTQVVLQQDWVNLSSQTATNGSTATALAEDIAQIQATLTPLARIEQQVKETLTATAVAGAPQATTPAVAMKSTPFPTSPLGIGTTRVPQSPTGTLPPLPTSIIDTSGSMGDGMSFEGPNATPRPDPTATHRPRPTATRRVATHVPQQTNTPTLIPIPTVYITTTAIVDSTSIAILPTTFGESPNEPQETNEPQPTVAPQGTDAPQETNGPQPTTAPRATDAPQPTRCSDDRCSPTKTPKPIKTPKPTR